MPRVLVADAQRLGFRLEPAAARLLVERMGANPVRLRQRARAAGAVGGRGGRGRRRRPRRDDRRHLRGGRLVALRRPARSATPPRALRIGERLIDQGENVTGLIYGLASRLRGACAAAGQLEEGIPPKQVESSLKMHPYAAKQLVAPPARHRRRRPARGDRGAGRPRALVPRRRRLRRRAGADPRPAGERRARQLRPDYLAALKRRCGRLWTSCGRRCSCAWRPSARPCRSSRRGRAARWRSRSASPPSTALSRRRKWVLTVLVSSRFSARSRSLRRIRFFCEAMLAMSHVPERAPCRLRAAADYSD